MAQHPRVHRRILPVLVAFAASLISAVTVQPRLSDGELRALVTKDLEEREQNPAKPFELAGFAFLESDGHATEHYYRRARDGGRLDGWQKAFAEVSLDRLARRRTYRAKAVGETVEVANFRGGKLMRPQLTSRVAAGAILSQLVVLNAVQL
ncbi:MAG: hypothetical protein ACKVP7_20010 [Hyphomicrobiaceae bacterium]